MASDDELFIQTPNLTVFSARRNSGKTHFMTYLLYQMKHLFDYILIINPTAMNGHWPTYTSNIIEEFDEGIITQIMDKQQDIVRKYQENMKIYNKLPATKKAQTTVPKCNKVLIIMDDCLGDTQFSSRVFERLASRGRHYMITAWITCQHYPKMPKCVRNNTDYMIISGNQTCYKVIFEDFGADYDNIKDFIAAVKEGIKDYGMFAIDNLKNKTYNLRAPRELPVFRIRQK